MAREKFRIGKYWLDQVDGSRNWYRFWYDARTGSNRKRTLRTANFEEAKIRLAQIVIEQGGTADKPITDDAPRHPKDVLLANALSHYWLNYSDDRPNPGNARQPGDLLLKYFATVKDTAPRVADFTKAHQEEFMRHLAVTLSVGSISRHLSIIYAAFGFGAKEQMIERDGEKIPLQLLEFAPKVYYSKAHISKVTDKPEPVPRNWTPSNDQVAAFLEEIENDRLFRYCILALNTWARPEAICDAGPWGLDNESQLLHLNPPERRQTKKFRPTIRVTRNLAAWIEQWAEEDKPDEDDEDQALPETWIHYKGEKVKSLRRTFDRHRERKTNDTRTQPREWTRYTFRHLMTTVARRAKVAKEQQSIFLGHKDRSGETTDWYGVYEPDYLAEAAEATDAFIASIDQAIVARAAKEGRLPKRRLIAAKSQPSPQDATIVNLHK